MKYENLTPIFYLIQLLHPSFLRSVEKNMKGDLNMNNIYYKIKIDEWKLQLIIDVLEDTLKTIPDEIGYIVLKHNIKHVLEELKPPF